MTTPNTTKIQDLDNGGTAAVNDYFVGERVAGTTKRFTYAPTLSMDPTPGLAGNLTLNGHAVGGATATEIGYLSGVTSAIQTQFGTKYTAGSTTQALGTPTSGTLTSCTGLPVSTGISGFGTNIATLLATNTSAAPTASAIANWDGNKNLLSNAFVPTTTSTTTNAATTTLNIQSSQQQIFTGTTTQTVVLPTLDASVALGFYYLIVNKSTGIVTVQTSGGNTVQAMASGTTLMVRTLSQSGTGTASWTWMYLPAEVGITGTSSLVRSTSPTIATPVINGFTDASSAAAGVVGEVLTSVATSVAISSGVITQIGSITLTAGDWMLWGLAAGIAAGTTTTSSAAVNIYTTSASLPLPTTLATANTGNAYPASSAGANTYFPINHQNVSISTNTTYYMNMYITYAVSTLTANSFLIARRLR